MKKIAMILGASVLSFASMSKASGLDFDGCYQLYVPGAMYPAFCLQGTTEEGINGSNVRLAIFGTNTSRVIKCARSSASNVTANSFTYFINSREELRLTVKEVKSGRRIGDAKLGNTTLKFMELDSSTMQRLTGIANDTCQD